MLHHYQTSSMFLIIFIIWILSFLVRTFDKTLRKYIISIGILLAFWMLLIIMKSLATENIKIFIWYLYYIPFILIPTCYYNASDYFSKNSNKIKRYIIISISIIMILFVITNNYHGLVFNIIDGEDNYTHELGYYIICLWIFLLLILSIVKLAKISIKNRKKIIIPFMPIIFGISYTIIYLLNIGNIRDINLSIVVGILFCIGLESFYRLDLIPNNLEYKNIFINSKLPIKIISYDGKLTIETQNKIIIDKKIIKDIKSSKLKDNYINKEKIYNIKEINGGYSIEETDLSELNKLKRKLKLNNEELLKQEELLRKQKNIKSKSYEIKLKNEIVGLLDKKINDKKIKISKLLDTMKKEDSFKLNSIKLLVCYCKRMSGLVISNYNEETFNNERLKIILEELFLEIKSSNVFGIINTNEFLVSSNNILIIYDIIFETIFDLTNVNFLLNIEANDKIITIKFLFDKKLNHLKKKIDDLSFSNISVEEKRLDDETELKINLKGGN